MRRRNFIMKYDLRSMQINHDLEEGRVLYQLHKVYCKPMLRRGKCTSECDNCKQNITSIFNSFYNRKGRDTLRNPYALLRWFIREKVAEISEQSENGVRPMKNKFGEIVDVNPMEVYIAKL